MTDAPDRAPPSGRFEPQDPDFEARIRESFARQTVMDLFGARLRSVEPGRVEIELPFRDDLCQQHGFFHAGVGTTIADSAAGYAAFSLMPAGSTVLAVEFKVSLVAPADGERIIAAGQVIRPGRTLTVSSMEVFAEKEGVRKLVITGLQTAICLEPRPGLESG